MSGMSATESLKVYFVVILNFIPLAKCGILSFGRKRGNFGAARVNMSLLDRLAHKYGTDKGTQQPRGNELSPKNYTRYYTKHFEPIRLECLNVLEIGVFQGASLKMWSDYFPNANIYGLDIRKRCKRYTDTSRRTKVFIGDQTDTRILQQMVRETGNLDIVIDDGGHHMLQQQTSFRILFPYVVPGGVYVIEDLGTSYRETHGGGGKDSTVEYLKELVDTVNGECEGAIADMEGISFYHHLAFVWKKS